MSEKYIGSCAVDSGQIMLVDPCYITDDGYTTANYSQTCAVTLDDDNDCCGPDLRGLAVATATGVGDGLFPVYATFDRHGNVVSVEIRFRDDSNGDFA